AEPLQLRLHPAAQPDHVAALAQQLAVARVEHGPAAGRQHQRLAGEAGRERAAFARAEAGLALAVEDHRDAGPGRGLDVVVDVGEGQAEALGQAPADRALAGAHRSDQDEVGGGGAHPGRVSRRERRSYRGRDTIPGWHFGLPWRSSTSRSVTGPATPAASPRWWRRRPRSAPSPR